METLKMVLSTLMTPIIGVSSYIETSATSHKKEAQVKYFASVQSTLTPEKQQSDNDIRERARTISELWND